MKYQYKSGVIVPFAHKHLKQLTLAVAAIFIASIAAMSLSASAIEQTVWDQGFEADTSGWEANGGALTQVSSGTGGTTSSDGAGHAVVEGSGPFSRFDMYRDTWPGKWTADLDVYLDTGWNAGEGFDYSVATNGSDGNHQRDFIFHATKDTSTGDVLVGASNNTNFLPREDLETLTNHYVVPETGWYTLRHEFTDVGGVLNVNMQLLDASDSVVFTEVRSDAADTIPAEIGGNRYSWFTANNIVGGLDVDNHQLVLNEVADTEKPVIEFVNPAASGQAVKGTFTATTHATDNDLLKRMAINVYNEANDTFLQACGSTPAATSLGVAEYEFSCDIDTTELADGMYTLRGSASDEADNVKAVSTQILVDNTRPTAEFSNPNGETYGDSVDVEFKMTDEGSGLDNMVVNIYDASNVLLDTCGIADSLAGVAEHTLNCTIDTSAYAEGTYNLKGGGFDTAGNNETISTTFVVEHTDSTDPVVELTYPTGGEELSDNVTFTGTITDDNNDYHRFLVRDEDNDVVYNSGNIADATSPIANASDEFDTKTLPDGEYRVVLVGFDASGNSARDRARVSLENYVDSKDECKDGGWVRGTFDGEQFRNQGDCVSHFTKNHHWWKPWTWNWWRHFSSWHWNWGWFGR